MGEELRQVAGSPTAPTETCSTRTNLWFAHVNSELRYGNTHTFAYVYVHRLTHVNGEKQRFHQPSCIRPKQSCDPRNAGAIEATESKSTQYPGKNTEVS